MTKRINAVMIALVIMVVTAFSVDAQTPKKITPKPTPTPTPTPTTTAITLSDSKIELTEGATKTLTVKSGLASGEKATWSSNSASTASVDANGKVTAVKAGSATITATAGTRKATCSVTVKAAAVTPLTLSETSVEIAEDATKTLTVKSGLAAGEKATWSSSSTSIATVDANGKVTAVKAGSATITATAGTKKATCSVTVKAPAAITLSETNVEIDEDATKTLTVSGLASGEKATWSSSNKEVATVDTNGKITAVKAGSATITATAGSRTAKCTVTVKTNDKIRREKIKTGFKSIPSDMTTILSNKDLFNAPKQDLEQFVITETGIYKIVQKEVTITNEKMCMLSDASDDPNIYPGAIIIANSDITKGQLTPLSGVERNKVKIFATFKSQSNIMKENITPTSGAIHSAMNDIMNGLFKSPESMLTAAKSNIKTYVYSSKEHMMLDFKSSASFLGTTVKANLDITKDKSKHIVSTNVEQDFYTIRLDDKYLQDVSTLFANDITWEDIKKQTGGQPLAIITSVTYGRRVYYIKAEETSDFALNGYQSLKYNSMASLSAKQELTSKQKTHTGELIGRGAGNLGKDMFMAKTDSALMVKISQNFNMDAGMQAVPVSYTLAILTGSNTGMQIDPTFSGRYYTTESLQKLPNKLSPMIKVDAGEKATAKVTVNLYAAKVWTIKPGGGKPTCQENVKILSQEHHKGEGNYWKDMIDLSSKSQYIEGYDQGQLLKLEVIYQGKTMIGGYIRMDGKNSDKETDTLEGIELRISGTTSNMYLKGHTQLVKFQ